MTGSCKHRFVRHRSDCFNRIAATCIECTNATLTPDPYQQALLAQMFSRQRTCGAETSTNRPQAPASYAR